jgi:hypothetical protein
LSIGGINFGEYKFGGIKIITIFVLSKHSNMKKTLNIGDKVMWRGAWGREAAKEAVVTGIEKCAVGAKNGNSVSKVSWDKVNSRQIVVDLDNGHWAYGNQLTQKE